MERFYSPFCASVHMASNFLKAMSDANFSVTTRQDGPRQFGDNAHMDRDYGRSNRGSNNYRGRSNNYRGRSRGRGGRYNHRPGGQFRGGVHPLSRLGENDDDFSMDDGAAFKSRYRPYGARQYGRGYQQNRNDERKSFDSKWFKIRIPDGRQHDKNWLMSKLQNQVSIPFECVELHYVGDSVAFFVDDKDVADALRSKSNKITLRDGSKLTIIVRPSDPPRITSGTGGGRMGSTTSVTPKVIDDETEKILMNCLAQRYIADTKSINLSKLSEDANLVSNNIKGNVNKPWLLPAIFDIIYKIQPELIGMDLSSNEIRSLDILRSASQKLPKLESLSLKNNELQSLDELEHLRPMQSLKHVFLEENPVFLKYQGSLESLKIDVRNKLASIETLDGSLLPPPITFDLPKSAPLPTAKVNYMPHPGLKTQISQFVQQYFHIYDQDDRQGLLDLYHDQATVSLCVNSSIYSKETGRERQQPLTEYFQISRNLKRVRDKVKIAFLIKHTKLTAVAFLNELPRTKHDMMSFALDVSINTAQFLCFTVRGHFFEGRARDVPRAFSRTFILLLSSDKSLKIINDQLHIRNCTKDRQKVELPSSQSEAVSPEQAMVKLSAEQQEIVKKFSEVSKMNFNYSLQCLEQNGWDVKKAGGVFTSLQAEGRIPTEAYM